MAGDYAELSKMAKAKGRVYYDNRNIRKITDNRRWKTTG